MIFEGCCHDGTDVVEEMALRLQIAESVCINMETGFILSQRTRGAGDAGRSREAEREGRLR